MLCSICGSESHYIFTQDTVCGNGNFRGSVSFKRCGFCTHLEKQVDDVYLGAAADLYNRDYSEVGASKIKVNADGTVASRSELLATYIAKDVVPKEKTRRVFSIIDFGAGGGGLINALRTKLSEAYLIGVEFSEHSRSNILSNGADVFVLNTDIDSLDSVDLIILSHTLEHIPDPLQLLKQLRSKLKPNGNLICLVPNSGVVWSDVTVFEHIHHFTPSSLINLFTLAGFAVSIVPDYASSQSEIAIIAQNKEGSERAFSRLGKPSSFSYEVLPSYINIFLRDIDNQVSRIIKRKIKFSIFGQGGTGIFLVGKYASNILSIIDEDPTKFNLRFNGIIIDNLDTTPPCTPVYIAFNNFLASEVIKSKVRGMRPDLEIL